MEIAVEGWRASAADWEAVRNLPAEEVPRLTDEQREVARKLGAPETDYARSALAGQRTQTVLLQKTEQLGRFLDRRLRAAGRNGEVQRVILRTLEHRFDVTAQLNGRVLQLRIDEDLVDEFFDSGSVEAEHNLTRVVDRALLGVH